ncbi:ER lumen protein retaining receptor [Heracleum sosnowskyi]|uniref:ER lumen protein retaining receptor n=1 Tax=Heracleum sosnowskyi TaxID=360622 RepID=A0AAD8M190_9APIA|nr:ER lumen protein retaining receptor [Heracleum sosnowskyi]
MGSKREISELNKLLGWMRRQPTKVKMFTGITIVIVLLASLNMFVEDHNHFFVASEAIHAAGILVLIHKLNTKRNCSGLSLKTQELTATFTAVRLGCSFFMEGDIHTVLDTLTLGFTAWVIYMMRFKLKSTYMAELDSFPLAYVLVPCAVLSVFVHPYTSHYLFSRILWAFWVYLESISVLPQLLMMQKIQVLEPFTTHYVFALGVAQFMGSAHWMISVYDTAGKYLYMLGSGYIWLPMVLLTEIVQTFILADFCYYYIKSVWNGRLLVSLPRPRV